MSNSFYDRLSGLDASFLEIEDHNSHMHIGSVGLYDATALTGPEGGLDFERIETFIDGQLYKMPRFRQKLATIPRLEHPVWIDDDSFNLNYHLRHTALPAPGSIRLLKRLAGRIMSQQLDRGKPLWETWFVEGVEGNRFAVIGKIHHCMADGIGGTDLATATMGPSPDYVPEPGPPWRPRPAPSGTRMLVDELGRRAGLPLALARAGGRALADPGAAVGSIAETARSLSKVAAAGASSASETPLNQPIGPHRRFDWNRIELDTVKQVGKSVGGKVNDVVLSVVAGSVRDFLQRRDVPLDDLDFRVLVPVSVRTEDERGQAGNRVSNVFVPMPLDEPDPLKRLHRVIETTSEIKISGQSQGMEMISEVFEYSGTLTQLMARAASRSHAANLVVTNVPGPPIPIYMLGARLLEAYPLVPLVGTQALGVALFSYAGGLHWGFNADWDRVPDLHDFARMIGTQFEELTKAAAGSG